MRKLEPGAVQGCKTSLIQDFEARRETTPSSRSTTHKSVESCKLTVDTPLGGCYFSSFAEAFLRRVFKEFQCP